MILWKKIKQEGKAKKKMIEGQFSEIVKECEGCQNIKIDSDTPNKRFCRVYLYPETKWSNGKICPMSTHVKREMKEEVKTQDPLKLSKQKAKKRG